jgi:Tfp pilus assembly protein PilF
MKPLLSIAAGLILALSAAAETRGFIPPSDDTIIERLPFGSGTPEMRRARELTRRLRETPTDLVLASLAAREHIQNARATADPRHLGYAEAALRPWWTDDNAPAGALVLRATIKQSLHDFSAARRDLELALAKDPSNAQGWLTLATIDTVQGRYDEARRACIQLARLGESFSATVAAAAIAGLNGQSASAVRQLESLLDRSAGAPVDQRLWATTQLAEIFARTGRVPEAEARFREALTLSGSDPYLLGAYSDFLLDQKRGDEATRLLANHDRQDGSLLRLAEARLQLAEKSAADEPDRMTTELRARFDAARRRGDSVHQREEARFLVRLGNDPTRALSLAVENWKLQREPADARLLLECALAAGRPSEAMAALDWMSKNRIEDKALWTLRDRLMTITTAKSDKP